MKSEEMRAKWLQVMAMVIFGSIGVFRREIPLSSGMIALARGILGTMFLLALVSLRGPKMDWTAIRKNGRWLVLSGAVLGINWVLLFEAYQYTTVAVATLCYYMAPIFVLIASPWVLREKLSLRDGVCIITALFGMGFISGAWQSELSGMTGIFFGLGAAVFYAAVILLNKKLTRLSAYDKCIMQLGLASIVLLPYMLATEDLGHVSVDMTGLTLLLVVGIVHTGIAYVLYFDSLSMLKAQTVAVYSYIDPLTAVLLSVFVLGEPMGPYEIMGLLLIAAATVGSEFPARSRKTADQT